MPIYSKEGAHFLFIHIPKTGGTTIEAVFRKAGFEEHFRTRAAESVNHVMRCTPQHFHARLLESLLHLGKFRGIFTVVRNPYRRMQSEFAMRHRDPSKNNPQNVCAWIERVTQQQKQRPFLNDNHIRPQAEFLVPGCEVFKLEDGFEAIFDGLHRKFGLSLPYDKNHRAMSSEKRSGYRSADVSLTSKAIDVIDSFYKRDFTCFDYQRLGTKALRWNRFRRPFSFFCGSNRLSTAVSQLY
jgi:hypothetical protein